MLTSLVTVVFTLAVVGFLVWLIVRFIPMPAPFPQIIIVVVVIALVLWMLSYFGIFNLDFAHHHR